MTREAIQSLIDLFGVEQGVRILNLFSVPEPADKRLLNRQFYAPGHGPRDRLEGGEPRSNMSVVSD